MISLDNFFLTDTIEFDSKPDSVPYNYRISYKVAQVCLIISSCCSGRSGCSLLKIQIFSNALNTKENMYSLKEYLMEKKSFILVRFDQSVNRAINYAIADDLLYPLKNGTLHLSNKGKLFVTKIKNDKSLLIDEKAYLEKYGKLLTNKKIESLISTWRYNDV